MKKIIKNLVAKSGYRLNSTKYILKQVLEDNQILKLEFDHILTKYIDDKKDSSPFTFMQIGAFDGIECDPLRKYLVKYNWRGIMLEPQPLPFEKLKNQYKDRSGLTILNAALGKVNGKTELYILEGDDLPEWSKGMASFDKQNILKHRDVVENLENCIKQIEIDTINFESLFKQYSIDHLDLLQIDTEGFDAEVLKMFPFERIKPSIIHFESKHIQKEQLESLLDYLIELEYVLAPDRGEDMMALLKTYI